MDEVLGVKSSRVLLSGCVTEEGPIEGHPRGGGVDEEGLAGAAGDLEALQPGSWYVEA
jgi:hypothetical protein